MDNLTHSLVGALIAQTGLRQKTGLAVPTMVIAANLPDIDAACFFWLHGAEHLGFRRGITHGPIAMLVLPLLLWGVMLGFDRWRSQRSRPRPRGAPVRPGWLLACAYIGCLSHPALDWLNTYGVRLLSPFSDRWFHGDSIFIIDVWMWGALIALVWSAARRNRRRDSAGQAIAGWGLVGVSTYILANGAMTGMAESRATAALTAAGIARPLVVASPPPLAFWRRDMFWRDARQFGEGQWGVSGLTALDLRGAPHGMDDPAIAALAATDGQGRAFLRWSRMPIAERGADGSVILTDQRYRHPAAVGRFQVVLQQGD